MVLGWHGTERIARVSESLKWLPAAAAAAGRRRKRSSLVATSCLLLLLLLLVGIGRQKTGLVGVGVGLLSRRHLGTDLATCGQAPRHCCRGRSWSVGNPTPSGPLLGLLQRRNCWRTPSARSTIAMPCRKDCWRRTSTTSRSTQGPWNRNRRGFRLNLHIVTDFLLNRLRGIQHGRIARDECSLLPEVGMRCSARTQASSRCFHPVRGEWPTQYHRRTR
mmetsp:Transcript_32250/g.68890  ORF Transcript_32250/g.68890 Transcript_32250/m.68890 type:complete len:219 (-) Transcript_32250:1077-1733(-)